jgi:hypothetical protein
LRHTKIKVLHQGGEVIADAPVILSASRRTDIPAFFAEQFVRDFSAGIFETTNPFNRKTSFVSTAGLRAIVFWTRNPEPMLRFLPELGGIGYYFLVTVTDYSREGWEPGMPDIADRIERFRKLAELIGPGRCVWRYDPIILSDRLTIEETLDRINKIAAELKGCTQDMIFSFGDIEEYRSVRARMSGTGARTPDAEERSGMAKSIGKICCENGMTGSTCAEKENFHSFGIARGSCIGKKFLLQACPDDPVLTEFLSTDEKKLKDPGQREDCGCIISRDIGAYGTCPAGCTYCYAGSR